MAERIGPRFLRSEPHQQGLAYWPGLLRPVERKHSGQPAEQAGDPGPPGFQHLLASIGTLHVPYWLMLI